jgi:hypothetical protein
MAAFFAKVSTRQPNRFPSAEFYRALIRIFVSAVDLVRLMSSGFGKNFEEYASRCLELARDADTETRTRLAKDGPRLHAGSQGGRASIRKKREFRDCALAWPSVRTHQRRRVGARTREEKCEEC